MEWRATNFGVSRGYSLLDAAGGGRGLAGRLGGELLARRLAAGGFACCLLGAGHFWKFEKFLVG